MLFDYTAVFLLIFLFPPIFFFSSLLFPLSCECLVEALQFLMLCSHCTMAEAYPRIPSPGSFFCTAIAKRAEKSLVLPRGHIAKSTGCTLASFPDRTDIDQTQDSHELFPYKAIHC